MRKKTSKLAIWIFGPIFLVMLVWAIYMFVYNSWHLFTDRWFMSLTMVFGSFIAGASAEGGGAVAFPVMTLIFKIPPEVARNFSLAIQSVGMTTASYLILVKRFRVEYRYLWLASIGGTIGIVLGTYCLVPMIPPSFAKMLFVTFWLSFGLVLFYINVIYKRETKDSLPKLGWFEKLTIVCVGIIGGGLSSLLGSGLDIFSFSYVTMRYHLSEKVATSTSVIIMAINSITGFILHYSIIRDFGIQEFNYWLVCIPIVVFGAPLGAYFINNKTRGFISNFLYVVIVAQFIGALFIIKPSGSLLVFSILVFFFGLFFFFGFAWLSKKIKFFR
ncbi:MAG: sulfite exporter TauE/SafE family protein [Cyclobacteriaceae bacterium]|nr:sulfite exporter TauE/SafE family protein [Cyclobacteriaceae bacterium]